ncbi:MAG: Ribonuclease P protein component 1 [Candidatus Methanogaster sp.]|nr:MAG: Ribonuclease P protein component 1 [ANME-2 cluster archaeon]
MTYEITPGNLVYHTLIGLETVVAGSTNPDIVGIRGVVVDETRNTLLITTGYSNFAAMSEATASNRMEIRSTAPQSGEPDEGGEYFLDKTIPKAHSIFIFSLSDGQKVRVNGDLLVARPEDRISRKHKN